MTLRAWLQRMALALGGLCLSVLIWWAGPLLAFADARPLEAAWPRVLLCAVVILGVAASISWDLYRRRRATRALQDEMIGAEVEPGDGAVLRERMSDALATLKRARGGKSGTLYDLLGTSSLGRPGRARPRLSSALASSSPWRKVRPRRPWLASAARATATGGSPRMLC